MTKGTPSFGKRVKRNHLLCPRCGSMSYHKQKMKCSSCAFPEAKRRSPASLKASRRRQGKKTYIKKEIKKSHTGYLQHPILMKFHAERSYQ
ncbi:RL37 [Hepatospora eriocheir]|uniref:Ribosomal protein L37 n=1 Tax=Hepatospora eriocheir TaxID=1081669 RepID=A0A1X0Q776_9MICR|nr:RL37 [Hepatospora eriocheir]